MYAFQYHRPGTVSEATALLSQLEDGRVLAGGQTLVAAMKLRLAQPSDLVDLGGIAELRGIRVQGQELSIGAMTTHAEVAASSEVVRSIPALACLAAGIGDRQVRAVGTLGGSIANNDPAADYPAAVLGLGATVVTDKRRIPADRFFTALYETALEPGELIQSVSFPIPRRAGYMKFHNQASRFALVGVMVSQAGDGSVRVAVTGAGPCVFRIPEMEQALAASFAPQVVTGIQVPAEGLNEDIHAGRDYRAHLITVMAKRAVESALAI